MIIASFPYLYFWESVWMGLGKKQISRFSLPIPIITLLCLPFKCTNTQTRILQVGTQSYFPQTECKDRLVRKELSAGDSCSGNGSTPLYIIYKQLGFFLISDQSQSSDLGLCWSNLIIKLPCQNVPICVIFAIDFLQSPRFMLKG